MCPTSPHLKHALLLSFLNFPYDYFLLLLLLLLLLRDFFLNDFFLSLSFTFTNWVV
jgi:hypothetical protein